MSGHTPGPWEAIGGTCVRTARNPDGSGGYVIADLYATADIRDLAEREANARLIAAAPAMLSALRAILDDEATDTKMVAEYGGYVLDDDLREAARAAIAKAVGE